MPFTACPNCDADLPSAAHYCARCGQEVITDNSFKAFFEQFLGDYFTFDSKIIRSVVPLIVRPGALTTEYMVGRRARYIPPLRMFIFLSILFFLTIGWSGAGRDGQTPLENIQDQVFWDNFFASVLPKLFFILLPLFALLVHLFYRDPVPTFVKPFIFSAHFHGFVFLAFTFYALTSRLFVLWDMVNVNKVLISLVLLYTFLYLWLALRKVYPRGFLAHALRFVSLLTLYSVLLVGAALLAVWGLK